MVGKRTATSWAFELYQLRLYSFEIYLCQNDLDLFHQIRASILHIRLTSDYPTGSPNTKSHWVPSSHLTLETELTCNSLIWGRGAGGAGAFLKFKSKNAQCSMQWVPKRVLHIVWALYHVYIVVQVTMNMAEYGGQPTNVTFGPIIRGLKSDIFHWGKGSPKKAAVLLDFFPNQGGRGPYPIFFCGFGQYKESISYKMPIIWTFNCFRLYTRPTNKVFCLYLIFFW